MRMLQGFDGGKNDGDLMYEAYADAAFAPDGQYPAAPVTMTRFDLPAEAVKILRDDCLRFLTANEYDLEGVHADQAGHDLWISRWPSHPHGLPKWHGTDSNRQRQRLTESARKLCRAQVAFDEFGDFSIVEAPEGAPISTRFQPKPRVTALGLED